MTLMVGRAQAALFDRGNGLVYGDFDNLSWTAVLPGSGFLGLRLARWWRGRGPVLCEEVGDPGAAEASHLRHLTDR